MPSDVRAEMHRTSAGWAAWEPRRASYLVAAATVSLSICLATHALLDHDAEGLSVLEFLVAFVALYFGAVAASRPGAVVVRHEGVELRRIRSVVIPWAE